MLKVMGLENGPDRDVPVQAQIDQVVAARDFLTNYGSGEPKFVKDGRPPEAGSARDVAEFLGEKTWSVTTVKRLFKLAGLPDGVKAKIQNRQQVDSTPGKSGLGVKGGV